MTDQSSPRIHHEVDFKAVPARIYDALLDQHQFGAFTNAAARIEREPGGALNLFGGRVIGRNVELISNERIVQAWRVEAWPSGVYSIVRFELVAQGAGTRLLFDHAGYLPSNHDDLNSGWPKMYWEPLRRYLDR